LAQVAPIAQKAMLSAAKAIQPAIVNVAREAAAFEAASSEDG